MGRLWATGVGDCVGGRRVELGYYNICLFVDIKTQFMQRHYYQTLLTFESRLQHAPPAPCLLPPECATCNNVDFYAVALLVPIGDAADCIHAASMLLATSIFL